MRIFYVSPGGSEGAAAAELKKLGHRVFPSDPTLASVDGEPDALVLEIAEGEVPPAAQYWRERGVPLIAVLKKGSSTRGLDKVDDFLLEGAGPEELELRIEVARRRAGLSAGDIIKAEGLTIDASNYEAMVDGEIVDLTYKEFELLKALATNRGRVMTRDVLLDRVWGYDYFGGTRTVDVHIRRLRAKLGKYESLIETVRNVGYKFKR